MIRSMLGAVGAVIWGASVQAQTVPPLAEVGLQPRIEALSETADANGFELGLLMSLRAVERTLQTRYEYGLGDRLTGLPFLRLDIGGRNPFAKKATPDTLSKIMQTALRDLESARAVLDNVAANGAIAPFELTLQDLWFDVNSNERRDSGEDVIEALAPILLGRRALNDMREAGALAQPLTVRFDQADHAWLTAYTHMLSGFGNLFLAFDPTPVFRDLNDQRAALSKAPTIPNTFDATALRAEIDALEALQVELNAALKPLREKERALRDQVQELRKIKPRDEAAIALLNAEMNRLRAEEIRPLRNQTRTIRAEISAANAKISGDRPDMAGTFRNEVDAFYVLLAALRQQPDAGRITAARDHWLAMISQNRVFWDALGAETDNDMEWIPNPAQTSALSVTVSADMAQSWQNILADAEALLEGRLLVPHPLLPAGNGISLKAYADNPAPLDLLNWVHGIGAYPYAAKGPMITQQRWLAFQRLTGGNAGGFALFFN